MFRRRWDECVSDVSGVITLVSDAKSAFAVSLTTVCPTLGASFWLIVSRQSLVVISSTHLLNLSNQSIATSSPVSKHRERQQNSRKALNPHHHKRKISLSLCLVLYCFGGSYYVAVLFAFLVVLL